jgi:hypothetical protein
MGHATRNAFSERGWGANHRVICSAELRTVRLWSLLIFSLVLRVALMGIAYAILPIENHSRATPRHSSKADYD